MQESLSGRGPAAGLQDSDGDGDDDDMLSKDWIKKDVSGEV